MDKSFTSTRAAFSMNPNAKFGNHSGRTASMEYSTRLQFLHEGRRGSEIHAETLHNSLMHSF
jgi:hypothetical protein